MGYVFLQVAFEILERLPLAASVELVLDVAEELLGAALSMQFAFLDMLWTMPAASSLDVYEACWYCLPSAWSGRRRGTDGRIGMKTSSLRAGPEALFVDFDDLEFTVILCAV